MIPCMLDLFTSYVPLTLLKTLFPLLFSLFQLGYFLLTCFQFTYPFSVSHMLLAPFTEFSLSIVLFFSSGNFILLNIFLGRF